MLNAFSASVEVIIFFVFPFVNVLYHIDWFVYVEPHFWPRNESSLIMVYDPFLCVVGSRLLTFYDNFYIYNHHRYWLVIFFFLSFFWCGVFVWVWNQGAGDFIEWIWECSFFFKFLEYFEEDRCKFFVCLVELPEEVVQSWNFVHMEFLLLLLQILFHFVWLACSNYLIFLYSVLAGSIFLEPCLFVLGGPICWNTTVNSILLWFFFSWGCYFSSFISYFVYLGPLSLFS